MGIFSSYLYTGKTETNCDAETEGKTFLYVLSLNSFIVLPSKNRASLVTQLVKNLPAMWETWVQSLDWEDPLEKGKTTHTSILGWRTHSMDYMAHGVAKSWIGLSGFHFHFPPNRIKQINFKKLYFKLRKLFYIRWLQIYLDATMLLIITFSYCD